MADIEHEAHVLTRAGQTQAERVAYRLGRVARRLVIPFVAVITFGLGALILGWLH